MRLVILCLKTSSTAIIATRDMTDIINKGSTSLMKTIKPCSSIQTIIRIIKVKVLRGNRRFCTAYLNFIIM